MREKSGNIFPVPQPLNSIPMDTAPSEGINSALSAKAYSLDRSTIVVDPELAELFSGESITPDDLRRVYFRLSASIALSKKDAAEAAYARCEELVFVVYRLTRITCVPPATFTETLVHPEQQCITPENVLLTFRNTRFQLGF